MVIEVGEKDFKKRKTNNYIRHNRINKKKGQGFCSFLKLVMFVHLWTFYTPPLETVRVMILLYPPQKIEFECPSVCLSVRPSTRQCFVSGLNLEHLFFKLLQEFISGRNSLGLKIGKFRQISTELWPLIYVKISFLDFFGACIDQCSSNFVKESISGKGGLVL